MGRVGGNGKVKRQGGWEGPRENVLSIFGLVVLIYDYVLYF